MSVIVIGCHYQSTEIAIREKLAAAVEMQQGFLQAMRQQGLIQGGLLLATCNRFEWIVSADKAQDIRARWQAAQPASVQDLQPSWYVYEGVEAWRHLLRVAVGLDSMLLGEPQIFGQLKMAYQHAEHLGPELTQVLPMLFGVAKQIRHQTDIASSPVSLAYAVVTVAQSIFALADKTVLCVGSGETMEKVVTYCVDRPFRKIYLANRTLSKAQAIATSPGIEAMALSDIPAVLPAVDIVVSAVSTTMPILGKGLLETAMQKRGQRPLLCVDLGMPRNIEPEVQKIAGLYLYNLDNLQQIVERGLAGRQQAATEAEQMVEREAERCYHRYQRQDAIALVRDFRHHIEGVRDDIMRNASVALSQGKDASEVVETALYQLTNKILHKPTVSLRKAIATDRQDLLQLTKDFFEITEKKI
jgi:glutamyl-tRNA reductase